MVSRPRGGAGRVLSANRRAGSLLFPGRYLEMREEELATGFEACAERVLRFLGEEDLVVGEPEVLVDLADAPPPHDRTP